MALAGKIILSLVSFIGGGPFASPAVPPRSGGGYSGISFAADSFDVAGKKRRRHWRKWAEDPGSTDNIPHRNRF